jgi:hypothetical protein
MPPTPHKTASIQDSESIAKVSPERLEDFRRIYDEIFDGKITQQEAVEMIHLHSAL